MGTHHFLVVGLLLSILVGCPEPERRGKEGELEGQPTTTIVDHSGVELQCRAETVLDMKGVDSGKRYVHIEIGRVCKNGKAKIRVEDARRNVDRNNGFEVKGSPLGEPLGAGGTVTRHPGQRIFLNCESPEAGSGCTAKVKSHGTGPIVAAGAAGGNQTSVYSRIPCGEKEAIIWRNSTALTLDYKFEVHQCDCTEKPQARLIDERGTPDNTTDDVVVDTFDPSPGNVPKVGLGPGDFLLLSCNGAPVNNSVHGCRYQFQITGVR